jgi:subtilisin family serine protease
MLQSFNKISTCKGRSRKFLFKKSKSGIFVGKRRLFITNPMIVPFKHLILRSGLLGFVCSLLFVLPAFPDHGDYDNYDVIIRVKPGVSINTINARYDTETQEQIIPNEVFVLEVQDSGDLIPTVTAMKTDQDLEWADYDYFGETPEATRQTLAVVDSTPSQSEYHDQDALLRMRAPEAQAINRGAGVIVAVIDTGVDYNNPDLTGHILRDSSNQVIGYDFVDDDNDPMDETDGQDDDNDGLTDEGAGHGTHVAGIIAVTAPDAKILPVRVLNTEGFGASIAIYKGVKFAIDNGAKVINLSFGTPTRSEVIQDAVDRIAFDPSINASVIASAGNDGRQVNHYPAAEGGNVISIASTDPNDVKAPFSNYNDWVDLTAPGVGIYSTFLNNQFAWWDGTSMSAPFVSGQIALIRSYFQATGGINPSETSIQQIAQYGTDYIYPINQRYKQGKKLGSGRVNLLNSVLLADNNKLADPLVVKKAIYKNSGKLVIKVKRESTDGTVPVLDVQGFGTMSFDPAPNRYTLKVPLSSAPTQVTINSSDGQIITAYVD